MLPKNVDTMLKATQRVRGDIAEKSSTRVSNDAMNRGWAIKPTAKSETAKLVSKLFADECKEDVFQIETNTATFANSAVKQSTKFITQIAIVWFTSFSEKPFE